MYSESDQSDAEDLYGKSKFIGELSTQHHAITIRTSMIGHELHSNYSLVNWFLLQKGPVRGFTKAIFSGFPTIELAHIIQEYIIPHPQLWGLYHVAANPINKFDLLTLIAERYQKIITITPDENTIVDRSLNATYFHNATGYVSPDWPQLIDKMYRAHIQ
jgi:dTDP-4-dehydrorhamnose reductase